MEEYEKCKLCGGAMDPNHVQQGNMHFSCFNKEIDVWFISLPHDPINGFYEKGLKQVSAFLEDIEDPYLISKTKMAAGSFYYLPEFIGF